MILRTFGLICLMVTILVAGEDPVALVADIAVAHGMPDARGAQLFTGDLVVRWKKADHAAVTRRLDSSDWSGTDDLRTRVVGGTHLRCRDGTWWMLRFRTWFNPGFPVDIDSGMVRPAEPGILTGDAAVGLSRATTKDDQADFARSLAAWFRPEDRADAGLADCHTFHVANQGWGNHHLILTLITARLGTVPDPRLVPNLRVLVAWHPDWILPIPPPLLADRPKPQPPAIPEDRQIHEFPPDADGRRPYPALTWFGKLVLPDAGRALRIATAGWFTEEMRRGDRIPAARCAAAIRALVGEDAEAIVVEAAVRAGREAIPADPPPPGSDLAEQVRRWNPEHSGTDRWRPASSDLAKLAELLPDERPARALARLEPCTIGDAALLAMMKALGADPRQLAGVDPGLPWTRSQRRRSATAIQAWLAKRGGEGGPVDASADLVRLPVGDLIEALWRRPEPERRKALTSLAATWQKGPPSDLNLRHVRGFLAVIGNHPTASAAVRSWPAKGELRPALAVWLARHGDPAALTALMAEALQPLTANEKTLVALREGEPEPQTRLAEERAQRPAALLRFAGEWMEPASLDLIVARLAGPTDDPMVRWLIVATAGGETTSPEDIVPLWGDPHTRPSSPAWGNVIRRTALIGLADQRPVGPIDDERNGNGVIELMLPPARFRFTSAKVQRSAQVPVRVADLTAATVIDQAALLHLGTMNFSLDLGASTTERDLCIAEVRKRLEQTLPSSGKPAR